MASHETTNAPVRDDDLNFADSDRPVATAADDPDRLLSPAQTRALLNLSPATHWRLRRAGSFPAPIQISIGRIAWRRRDLIAWMEARRGDPLAPATPITPARGRRRHGR